MLRFLLQYCHHMLRNWVAQIRRFPLVKFAWVSLCSLIQSFCLCKTLLLYLKSVWVNFLSLTNFKLQSISKLKIKWTISILFELRVFVKGFSEKLSLSSFDRQNSVLGAKIDFIWFPDKLNSTIDVGRLYSHSFSVVTSFSL